MNLKTKVKQLEKMRESNFRELIKTFSDAELEEMCSELSAKNPILAQLHQDWLKTLSDEEIEILCADKPNAKRIWKRFDDYKREKKYRGENRAA